jgi:hypothetical protein
MFRKINFKWMLISFSILLLLVILTHFLKNRGSERNFNSNLVTIDTAKISNIYIKTKISKDEVRITRSGNKWFVVSNGKNMRTDKQAIDAMLGELANIKAERLAASDKNEWGTFEVTDSAGIKVRVEEGGSITANLIIGKFSYQQNPQKFSTYVRLNGQNEVYSVPGFLSMTFGKGLNGFRDKTLINVIPENITQISFNYPSDSSFALKRDMNHWKIGNQIPDSAKTADFIQKLSHLSSYDILENDVSKGKELFSVKIEGNNFSPIDLKAFESDSTIKYLITSSINPDASFSGLQSDLFKKIFASKKIFFVKKK